MATRCERESGSVNSANALKAAVKNIESTLKR